MSWREQPRRKCKSKTQSQGLSVLELAKAVVPSASRSDSSSIVVSPEGSRVSSASDSYSSTKPVPARSIFTDTSLTDSLVRSEGNTPVSDISPPELASPRSVRRKSLSDISGRGSHSIASIVDKLRQVDSRCNLVGESDRTLIESDNSVTYPMMSDDERDLEWAWCSF